MTRIELFARLEGARTVLVAGAGGGFDVYAGLPLALALEARGVTVHLANLSFSELVDEWVQPGLARVGPGPQGSAEYFPEPTLARWRLGRDEPSDVYAFACEGVVPLRAAYERLAHDLSLDAVVLVDGGSDILLTGDEAALGTPDADMTSLAAVAGLSQIPVRLVAAIGFGVDAHHGVAHTQVLENVAALTASGAYLGAFSVPPGSPEATAYLDAVDHATLHTSSGASIVNGQIAASLRGEFGNVPLSDRTANSDLFVNPLMNLYLTFDLDGLASRVRYLDLLLETGTRAEVALAIEGFRATLDLRPGMPYPH